MLYTSVIYGENIKESFEKTILRGFYPEQCANEETVVRYFAFCSFLHDESMPGGCTATTTTADIVNDR